MKNKISSFQMFLLMFQMILSSSVLLMPSITTMLSGKDMWMTPIFSMLIGYLTIWLAFKLYKLAPHGSFVKLLESTFGKVIGKGMNVLFIIFQVHIIAIATRDYGEFIVTNFYLKTPVYIIITSMLILCAWVVSGGIEVLARTGQVFIPIITICTLFIFVFLIPELDPSTIFPIFEKGAAPVFKGSVVVAGWFCQIFLVVYILPFVKQEKSIQKWGYICVTGIGLLMLIANITVFMLMSESASFYNYPVFTAARYIAYAEFFEHVEAIVMMVWVLGEFFKISFYYFTIYLSLSETLELQKPVVIILPIGLLLLLSTFWLAKDFQMIGDFISKSGTLYILTGFFIFPLVIYALTVIKQRLKA
ncbi:GerAB/ArcD/ProY family transporter [Paenibacillus luteus]|uniref:GerAB/ArcD/ProY family transporter n=1 Tax=Paenibacillus luteus TaxID=2545753 RepID=UPI0011434C82|nr:endospore germination permease [Paenibacillus luteus]